MNALTLRDVVAPIFRYRKIVIFTFLSVFVCATAVAWFWAGSYYRATMQIVVEAERTDPTITAGQNAVVNNPKGITMDQVASEVVLLQGSDMLRMIVTTCGLVNDKWSVGNVFLPSDPQQRRAMKEEAAARALAKKIKVEAQTISDVINVSYGAVGDPATPACVLQNLGKLYLEKHVSLRRPTGSAEFFAAEAEKYHKALTESEARLTEFSAKQGVAAPDVLRGDLAQQLAIAEANIHHVRQAIAADERRLENTHKQMAATPERSSTQEVSNSSYELTQNLQASLLAAQIKRTQLLLKYDSSYPLVKEIDDEIAQTQAAITHAQEAKYINKTTDRDLTYEFLREDAAKTQADLASQQATEAAITETIRSLRAQLVNLDSVVVKQGALLREAKANEENYLLYLGKREQERTSDALDKQRIGNVAIAVPPEVPTLPAHSPTTIVLLGIFAAFFTSLATAYIAEHLDSSFRTPSEVTELLNIPVVASMPRLAV
jgi:polysaccharide biosynthesis transport protein